VRLDSANRSFAALVIFSLLLGVYVLCGAIGCVLVPLLIARLSDHGLSGLVGHGQDLLLAADRRAVRACGRDPLVGALLKVVRGPAWGELQAAAALGGSELLDLRVAQLESGSEPKLGTFTPAGSRQSVRSYSQPLSSRRSPASVGPRRSRRRPAPA
jgi:hypothetical protein